MTRQTQARRITTHEAAVKTASVEIQALTVSDKQMTLAVFRQLKRGDLIDRDTIELRGVPWGTVNYHPGGCEYHGEHLHVVWQLGEELRHSYVPVARGYRTGDERDLVYQEKLRTHALATAWLLAQALAGETGLSAPDRSGQLWPIRIEVGDLHWVVGEEDEPALRECLWASVRWCRDLEEKSRELNRRWERRYAELAGLDQLFIAV